MNYTLVLMKHRIKVMHCDKSILVVQVSSSDQSQLIVAVKTNDRPNEPPMNNILTFDKQRCKNKQSE